MKSIKLALISASAVTLMSACAYQDGGASRYGNSGTYTAMGGCGAPAACGAYGGNSRYGDDYSYEYESGYGYHHGYAAPAPAPVMHAPVMLRGPAPLQLPAPVQVINPVMYEIPTQEKHIFYTRPPVQPVTTKIVHHIPEAKLSPAPSRVEVQGGEWHQPIVSAQPAPEPIAHAPAPVVEPSSSRYSHPGYVNTQPACAPQEVTCVDPRIVQYEARPSHH